MNVTGRTKTLGVIGDPIEHSFSPELHNYISKKIGNDYIYSAYHDRNTASDYLFHQSSHW